MPEPTSYCQAVPRMAPESLHHAYHDSAYGFPLIDDNELFGRLILEINQAGLSWTTILNKQENFRLAYDQFDIQTIANYGEEDKARLLADAGIIRNKLKVKAAIHNAQVVQGFQKEYGSFKAWLDHHHPLSKPEWVRLFRKVFTFTGGEITNEFLMSTGYLAGAHEESCPIYARVMAAKPAWAENA